MLVTYNYITNYLKIEQLERTHIYFLSFRNLGRAQLRLLPQGPAWSSASRSLTRKHIMLSDYGLIQRLEWGIIILKLTHMILGSIHFLWGYWTEGLHFSLLAVVQRLPSVRCLRDLSVVLFIKGSLLH